MNVNSTGSRRLLLTLLMLLAAVVRWLASCTDFWLDEIWTLEIAASLSSPLEILTSVHHSNNHHLNTLFFYLIGNQENWVIYRIPSMLAGMGTILLLGVLARERGAAESWIVMLLAATSYFLVYYSSEARGYSLLVFFCLAAFQLLLRFHETRLWWIALLFGLSVIGGFLSHLSCVQFYLAAGLWSARRLWKSRSSVAGFFSDLTRCHFLPIAGVLVLYFIDVREMLIFAGPPRDTWQVLGNTAALTLGTPQTGSWPWVALAASGVLLVLAWVQIFNDEHERWIFYFLVTVGAPIAILVAMPPDSLFERYLIVSVAFLLLLIANLLGQLWRSSGSLRLLGVLLLVGMLSGNVWAVTRFVAHGRGQYHAALQYIADETVGRPIRVGTDHDFRNKKVLGFYKDFFPERRVEYFDKDRWPPNLEWIIIHELDVHTTYPNRDSFHDEFGNEFVHVETFLFSGHAGMHWFVYRNLEMLRAMGNEE